MVNSSCDDRSSAGTIRDRGWSGQQKCVFPGAERRALLGWSAGLRPGRVRRVMLRGEQSSTERTGCGLKTGVQRLRPAACPIRRRHIPSSIWRKPALIESGGERISVIRLTPDATSLVDARLIRSIWRKPDLIEQRGNRTGVIGLAPDATESSGADGSRASRPTSLERTLPGRRPALRSRAMLVAPDRGFATRSMSVPPRAPFSSESSAEGIH